MIQFAPRETLGKTSKEILSALIYYDIFHYPLTEAEIRINSEAPENFRIELDHLVSSGIVRESNGYYYLGEDDSVIERRKKGNEEADRRMKHAMKYAKLIGSFPFVRGVMISGSLSKGYMEKDSDIDFFIVTDPGKLWLARTFLVFFKKLILFNSHKNFCVNYFIDTAHLEIPDKNRFTATEAVTLIPMYNSEVYHAFCKENNWAWGLFPNLQPRNVEKCAPYKRRGLKWLSEKIFGGRIGDFLDTRFMKMTIRRWKKKFPHFDSARLELAMRSRKYVSKHHPSNFQSIVLTKYETKILEFEQKYNLSPGKMNG